MMLYGLYALVVLLVLLVIAIGLVKDLLRAAVCLALASVVLSVIMFLQGARMAAVFELSVCAGLITVLFVSTISLTKDSDQKMESRVAVAFLPAFLLLFLGLDFFLVKLIVKHVIPGMTAGEATGGFRNIFWVTRTTDILGQISLILAGVFAILAIFKRTAAGRKHE